MPNDPAERLEWLASLGVDGDAPGGGLGAVVGPLLAPSASPYDSPVGAQPNADPHPPTEHVDKPFHRVGCGDGIPDQLRWRDGKSREEVEEEGLRPVAAGYHCVAPDWVAPVAPEPVYQMRPDGLHEDGKNISPPAAPAELRPPPEHEGKPLHWVEWLAQDPGEGRFQVWQWSRHQPDAWTTYEAWELPSSDYMRDYRYLGPAEWRPAVEGVNAAMEKVGGDMLGDLLRTQMRVAQMETEAATLRDQLASVSAHNVELVAKYEALRRAVPRETPAFPANALGHAPKVGR